MGLENWQSPDELPLLAVGISQQTQYRPEFAGDLAGRTLRLAAAEGPEPEYAFHGAHDVERRSGGDVARGTYDATVVRDGIYLVDVLLPSAAVPSVPGLPVNETWALDLNTGRVTVTTSYVVDRDDGDRWVASADRHYRVAGAPGTGTHAPSTGMVGRRVLWQYSDTDRYDHVYLNAHNFAWQCVSGVEQGLTELDRTRAYGIADDLYFFGWSEHVQPVESMLFVDLGAMRTYGRMFGWEARTAEVLHHQFGARGTLLNVTTYPDGAQ